MSVYSVKGKGWRYDFTLKGKRHTKGWFKTKNEAKKAEVQKREEVNNPPPVQQMPTDMAFLDLVNRRLDYLKAYRSDRYYIDTLYSAKRWVKQWKNLNCSDIAPDMVQQYILKVAKEISSYSANKELRCLRALFNFGMKPVRGWIDQNPTIGIEFLPVEKKIKYVPPKQDVLKVIAQADADTQDYLWTIALTMGRMSEVNRMTWNDVDLKAQTVTLYTRKKKGGSLTPRKISMAKRLYDIMERRYRQRDRSQPWVFVCRYWDKAEKHWKAAPYKDRKTIMTTLCKKAGVRYFRFHALRHFGASLLDENNVSISTIQRILGHENRLTTEIYLHSIGDAEKAAISRLDDCFEAIEQ